MDTFIILIGFLGGLVAGVMNTFAGFGSVITLSILMELMGLPANVANGTNRLTIIFAGITSTYTFHKKGKLKLEKGKLYIISTFLGALIGVGLALMVSNEQFKIIFKFLIVFLFFILLLNPKRMLREHSEDFNLPAYILVPVFLLLGIYGGFIQMGMGVFFIVSIVVLGRFNMVEGNALKAFIVLVYTIVALAIFWYHGMVNWKAGLSIAAGQGIGAYLAARFASENKQANVWAYRILLIIVVFVILHYFGVLGYLSSFVR